MERVFDAQSIRIATFDLDGTTLINGYMSNTVKDALVDLANKGIAVAVSTGRDISQIPMSVLECFKYRITTNGGSVTDIDGNVIYERPIPAETAVKALRIIRQNGGRSALYFNGMVMASPAFLFRLLRRTNYLSKDHRKSTKSPNRNNKIRPSLPRFVSRSGKGVFKIQSFFNTIEEQKRAAEQLRRELPANPCMMEDGSMETTFEGVSKAHGMQKLCGYLGCRTESVIAFGDSANDLELMESAGYAVGMGNSEECVIKSADYITDPVTEDGVATAIRNLFSL